MDVKLSVVAARWEAKNHDRPMRRAQSDYLTGPATLTQQWDHRPDLEFSQNTGACDPEVARRYKEHVPAE
jgi:hypothetical protein